jgi:hypothetical protein
MDVKLAAVLLYLMLIPSALAIDIQLEIGRQMDGSLQWNQAARGPPQTYSINWRNTGSVYCKARPRIVVFNASGTVYTAWGSEAVMMPGDSRDWRLHSYLDSGEYEYNITIYHCNGLYTRGPYHLSVVSAATEDGVLEITGSSADDAGVDVSVRSSADADIIIIPADYPLGWVFESGETSIRAGETRTLRLPYDPIKWEGQLITFVAASADGSHMLRKPVILKRAEFPYDRIIFILTALFALMIYLYYKKIISQIWKR